MKKIFYRFLFYGRVIIMLVFLEICFQFITSPNALEHFSIKNIHPKYSSRMSHSVGEQFDSDFKIIAGSFKSVTFRVDHIIAVHCTGCTA